MANITYSQGETHILAKYFTDEPVAYGPFFIGLGNGGVMVHEAATLDDVNEITGTGYARLPVQRNNSPLGWQVLGDYVQSPELRFKNIDPRNCWEPCDFAFLTLSPEGSLGDTILIAADEFPHSVTLEPGNVLRVIFRFHLKTEGSRYERFHSACASVVANAEVFGDAVIL